MARHSQSDATRLADLSLFDGCSRRELRAVQRRAMEIDVDAGKVLTREGEPGREFLIVLAGLAVATHDGAEVATFGPGDCFGEIALLDHSVRTATVVAKTPMRVAVVASNDFDRILEEVPALAQAVMRSMARRLGEA
jgi:CRP-like cAMP-binding protein